MRVIGGRWKGHRLVSFQAKHVRPTVDRIKESVFNHWQNEIEGARVLDLFSGTGSLAIEAASRGAREVIAVEKHPQSLKIIRQNLTQLKVSPGTIRVVGCDVFKFIEQHREEPFDIILVDPPFTQKMAHDVMMALSKTHLLSREGGLVIESSKWERLDDAYGKLSCYRSRFYGDKYLSFFSLNSEDSS